MYGVSGSELKAGFISLYDHECITPELNCTAQFGWFISTFIVDLLFSRLRYIS